MKTRLICHLLLIVPEECALRVGNKTRASREGEVVVFDDSVDHEAWSLSKELRVAMIVWRPELSEKERALVGAMLEAADQVDRLPQRAKMGASSGPSVTVEHMQVSVVVGSMFGGQLQQTGRMVACERPYFYYC